MRSPLVCRPAVGAQAPRARVVGRAPAADAPRGPPRSIISTERRVESFADDLNTRRGIVSGRVALLPRSTEIQPYVAPIRPSPTQTPRRCEKNGGYGTDGRRRGYPPPPRQHNRNATARCKCLAPRCAGPSPRPAAPLSRPTARVSRRGRSPVAPGSTPVS